VDSDGIPAPKVIYKTSENSRRMHAFHAERAKESMEASGAKSTSVMPQMRESGWHLLGTARLGTDPKHSVLDEFGRTHDVPNLYVWDLSAFPTGAGANPTATLMAMAHRQATQFINTKRNVEAA